MSARRPSRSALLVGLALLLALAAAVWTTRGSEQYPAPLDPRNPGPDGAQALAEVLSDQGVDVTVARSADELEETALDQATTVLVTGSDALSPGTLGRLQRHADRARVVLVEPSYPLLQAIDDDLRSSTLFPDGSDDIEARCAGAGGHADVEGLSLEVDMVTVFSDDGQGPLAGSCFAVSGGSALAELPEQDLVLFGAGDALSNGQVLRGDNAAVALRLAGAGDRLVWYVPDPADVASDEAVSLSSLLPRWIVPGLWLSGLALVALALWRGRRLGPLSTEPLPVVVRAVETARSRGRMYRRSGDREHAARALRRSARADVAARLRLDRRADTTAVVEATARHLGMPREALQELLDDRRPPASDQELVGLAQELARLRREVRRG